jgi:hypothetical protein
VQSLTPEQLRDFDEQMKADYDEYLRKMWADIEAANDKVARRH